MRLEKVIWRLLAGVMLASILGGTGPLAATRQGANAAALKVPLHWIVHRAFLTPLEAQTITQELRAHHVWHPAVSAGTRYMVYTVSFRDRQGWVPLLPHGPGFVTISDNNGSKTVPGQLLYLHYSPRFKDPFVAGGTLYNAGTIGSSTRLSLSASLGHVQFAVLNLAKASGPVRITAASQQYPVHVATRFLSVAGPLASLDPVQPDWSLGPGQFGPATFQLEDAYGNPIAKKGVRVKLYLSPQSPGAYMPPGVELNGRSTAFIAHPVVLKTNRKGRVTARVANPRDASGVDYYVNAAGTFGVERHPMAVVDIARDAEVQALQLTNTPATSGPVTPAAWPDQVTLSVGSYLYGGSPDAPGPWLEGINFSAGTPTVAYGMKINPVPSLWELNDGSDFGDDVMVTAQNPAIVSVGKTGGYAPGEMQLANTEGSSNSLPLIHAVAPGKTTVTIMDISSPLHPYLTIHITVVPATPASSMRREF